MKSGAYISSVVPLGAAMTDPEHERLATAARWCGLLALIMVPASVVGIWLGLWPLISGADPEWSSWEVTGLCLSLAGTVTGLVLLVVRGRAVLDGLRAPPQESTRRQAPLRAIVHPAAHAILPCDGDGRIVSANAAASRLFGYPPPGPVGALLHKLLPDAPLNSVNTNRHKA